MKKQSIKYELCVITLFIGLLLTFSIIFTVNATVENSNLSPQCYDGSSISGDGFLPDFTRAAFQNSSTLSRINEYRYRLFGVVDHPNVFGGKEGFLFEIENEENGYNYIEDYTGGSTFTVEESVAILRALREKKAGYAQRGAQYLVVVLPNAQSVYDEYMPDYLGAVSANTRLAALENFLLESDFGYFLNPTEDLDAKRGEGLLYNNTENTLNSRGMYFIYRAICDHISPTVLQNVNILQYEALDFYHHTTKGKQIAEKANLADVALNQTVSLSNTTKLNYRFVYDVGYASTSQMYSFGQSFDVDSSPSLLLQFGDEWEASQAEPFFSGTFGRVTYQIGYEDSPSVFEQADPDIVIQFIREDELSLFLQH